MKLLICYGKNHKDDEADRSFLVVAETVEDAGHVMREAGFDFHLPLAQVRVVFGIEPSGVPRVLLTI